MRRSDIVFFLSGVCALVDQTVWARLLARVCGSDAAGVALVLAVFMAGLALGSALGARLAARTSSPVRTFVKVEIALALWAGLSPELLGSLPPIPSPLVRGLVAAGMLLGPTFLMGLTFPLMGRLTIAGANEAAMKTSEFYGANTLGAAVGALLGPFVLMPAFGLTGTLRAAAIVELSVAGLAWLWLTDNARATKESSAPKWGSVHLAAGLLGASALALEVLLTRLLVSLLGASIHAFGIVLAVFLVGIGLGSRWIDPKLFGSSRILTRRAALAAVPLTLLGLNLLAWRAGTDLFGGATNRMPIGVSVERLWLGHAVLAALALLPLALAFGRALPSAASTLIEEDPERDIERTLAGVYAANTVGALLGAVLAAFVLLPMAGLRGGLLIALALAWLGALALKPSTRETVAALGCAAALLPVFTLGGPPDGTERLLSVHGSMSSVAVDEAGDVHSLRVNGKVVATSAPVDLRLQRLLGHIPGLLHGEVKSALCIGMGTGMTAGSLLDLASLESLRVVEISTVVPLGAREFDPWNGGLLDDPRTEVVIADGRHELATNPGPYDLVTADPIHPWTAGSSDLYALEHFERMAAALAPGGVASQWLPLYQLSEEDVQTVIATWCAAFEHTSAWLTAYDLVLVGSRDPLPGPESLLAGTWSRRLREALLEAGIDDSAELAGLYVGGDAELRSYAKDVSPMEDDRPVLEFRAPRSFLEGYCTETLRWAVRPSALEALPPSARPSAERGRAALLRFLEALPQGWTEAARLYGEELLNPEG